MFCFPSFLTLQTRAGVKNADQKPTARFVFVLVTLQAFPAHPVPGWHCFNICVCKNLQFQHEEKPAQGWPISRSDCSKMHQEGCSEANSFQLVTIAHFPSSTRSRKPRDGYFPNNSVVFPFSAGKNAFKATNGSESSERFIQSIYSEWLSQPELREGGRRGRHHPARGRAANKSRERGREGRKMQVWYPNGFVFAAKLQAWKKNSSLASMSV